MDPNMLAPLSWWRSQEGFWTPRWQNPSCLAIESLTILSHSLAGLLKQKHSKYKVIIFVHGWVKSPPSPHMTERSSAVPMQRKEPALSMGDSALPLLLYIQPFVSPPLIHWETSSSLNIKDTHPCSIAGAWVVRNQDSYLSTSVPRKICFFFKIWFAAGVWDLFFFWETQNGPYRWTRFKVCCASSSLVELHLGGRRRPVWNNGCLTGGINQASLPWQPWAMLMLPPTTSSPFPYTLIHTLHTQNSP